MSRMPLFAVTLSTVPIAVTGVYPRSPASRAGAGVRGGLARHLRIGAGSERRDLLVPDRDPAELAAAADGIGQRVQRIADHTMDSLDARIEHQLD